MTSIFISISTGITPVRYRESVGEGVAVGKFHFMREKYREISFYARMFFHVMRE